MRQMDITRTNLDSGAAGCYRLFYPTSWRPALNPYADLARRAASAWFRELGVVDGREHLAIAVDAVAREQDVGARRLELLIELVVNIKLLTLDV